MAIELTYNHHSAVKEFLNYSKLKEEKPSIEFLAKLLKAFSKIPYENLTKIIKSHNARMPEERYRLPDIVMDDHIQFGTGGTCFSLTYFFQSILKGFGFETYTVMADRSYGENTHCASIVLIDGVRFLADPGYCLDQPVPLEKPGADLPHRRLIITPDEAKDDRLKTYTIVTIQGGESKVRYRLKDRPTDADEFLKLWQASFDWPMMRHLCITTTFPEGYIFLRDRHVRHNTFKERHQQKIHHDFEKEVEKLFHIDKNIIEHALTIVKCHCEGKARSNLP